MRSIRTTLMASLVGGVLVATGVAGVVFYARAGASLEEQFDETLVTRARGLASLLEDEGKIEFDFVPEAWPEYLGGDEPEYFQIRIEARDLVLRSPTLNVNGRPADLPRGVDASGAPVPTDLRFPDGRAGRTLGIEFRVPGDGDEDDDEEEAPPVSTDAALSPRPAADDRGNVALVIVARSRDALDASLAALRDALLVAGGLLAAVALLAVLLAVRAGLRPLVTLGEEVGLIDAGTLSRRVGADGLPRELLPTAGKLNELLARLEAAFERERRMTGNVAHELRTPIAELRTAVDIARRWPDDVELKDEAVDAADAVSVQMRELVSGLLRLSRITSGEAELAREPVPVRPLVEELWHAFASAAATRELELDDRTPPQLTLVTDRTLLSVAVTNLFDNAVRFAEPGSSIVWDAIDDGNGSFLLSLENRTSEVSRDDVEHLTEPFWQKDTARAEPDHAGLGLTLVRSVVTALGGDVRFSVNGTFRVTLELPRHAPASPATT